MDQFLFGPGPLVSAIAALYDPTRSYSVGSYCSKGGKFWRCTTACSGAWNAANWEPVKVASELEQKINLNLVGANGGIATLDQSGNLPLSQMGNFNSSAITSTLGYTPYEKSQNGIPAADLAANIPVSTFVNDAGYLTQHQDISGKADLSDIPDVSDFITAADIPDDVSAFNNDAGYITSSSIPTNVSDFTNDAGYLTQHQDISGKANSADLAAVATSGSYNDLSDKPSIPTATSDLTNDSGFLTAHQDISNLALKSEIPTKVSDLTNDSGYLTAHQDISGKLDASLKGANSGLAELDATGKVPSSQLPSYVDDVESYASLANFPQAGETGKIYIDTTTNITYRWSGTDYVPIGSDLALGTTSSTAFRGDYGQTAYQHAQAAGSTAYESGMYKITVNAAGHIVAATPITKNDILQLGISGDDTTYDEATTTTAGLMSAADKTKLDGFKAASNYLTSHQDISGKANSADLATVATSGDYDDLTNKPTIPTAVSDLTNDTGFITSAALPTALSDLTDDLGVITTHQDISGKANTADLAAVAFSGDYGDLNNTPTIPTAVSDLTNDAGYLTAHQDISGKANSADLATVATSGDYDDLTNKPTIPTKVSDLTNDSDFLTNETTYTLTQDSNDGHTIVFTPSSGGATTITIPDQNTTYEPATTNNAGLMSAADKAKLDGIQDYATATTGTVTKVKVNGQQISPNSSGVVDIGTVITEHQSLAAKADLSETVTNINYNSNNKVITKTMGDEETPVTVVSVATLKSAMSLSKSDVNLGNVENKSAATILSEMSASNVTNALGYTPPTSDTTYSISINPSNDHQLRLVPSSGTTQTVTLPDTDTWNELTTTQGGYVGTPLPGDDTYFLNGLGSWTKPPSSVTSVAGQTGQVVLDKTDVGLANVDNTSDANKPISTATQNALDLKLNTSLKGAVNGLAELDSNGKVPSSQLPSYVDDVLAYADTEHFPVQGESGKIYIANDTNKTYRWGTNSYIEISSSLAIGETASSAFAGDKGAIAYAHAVTNKGVEAYGGTVAEKVNGLLKFRTNSEGHIISTSAVAKSDITALGIPGSDTTYEFDGTYNATSNKVATVSTVNTAITGLGAAASKGVVTGISSSNTDSTDVPTTAAVTSYILGQGFLTSHQDITGKADKTATVSAVTYDSTNKVIQKTINGTTSDIITVSTLKTDLGFTKNDIGLGNVENKSSATIRGELTSSDVTAALGITPISNAAVASSSALGLVKIGFTRGTDTFPVTLSDQDQMYVSIPWDTTIGTTALGTTATTITGAIAEHESDISAITQRLGNVEAPASVFQDIDFSIAVSNWQNASGGGFEYTVSSVGITTTSGIWVFYGSSYYDNAVAPISATQLSAGGGVKFTTTTKPTGVISGYIRIVDSVNGIVPITRGGTQADNASDARINLGLGSVATHTVTDNTSATAMGNNVNIPTNRTVYNAIYNGLDKNSAGFMLDARQGKALNDQLSKFKGKYVQETEDLNDYYGEDHTGLYNIAGNAPANCPVTWAQLMVIASGSGVVQMLLHENYIKIRRRTGSPLYWTDWRTLLMNNIGWTTFTKDGTNSFVKYKVYGNTVTVVLHHTVSSRAIGIWENYIFGNIPEAYRPSTEQDIMVPCVTDRDDGQGCSLIIGTNGNVYLAGRWSGASNTGNILNATATYVIS